jgi:hypothetical protein
MTIKQSAWTGMVPVDDAALAVADSGGAGHRQMACRSRRDEQEQIRTSLDAVTARNPNIQVRKVASGHGAILRRDFRAIAEAVREAATVDHADS